MKRNGLAFTVIAIVMVVLVGTAVVFVKSRSKTTGVCINNLRQIDEDAAGFKTMQTVNSNALVLVPVGAMFSNATAIFGNDYKTSKTNPEGAFYVKFNNTNAGFLYFEVKNDAIAWSGMFKGDPIRNNWTPP